MKFTLGLASILPDNLSMVGHWINHYLAEGVQHIFFIQKKSIRDVHRKLRFYDAYITIIQVNDVDAVSGDIINNKFLHMVKESCEWIMMASANEYIYARNEFLKIPGFLSWLPSKKTKICIPCKYYGGEGVTTSDLADGPLPVFHKRAAGIDLSYAARKLVCRTKYLVKIIDNGRDARVVNIDGLYSSAGGLIDESQPASPIGEEAIDLFHLHMNKYPVSSAGQVERTRDTPDDNAVEDNDLADKPVLYDNSIYRAVM